MPIKSASCSGPMGTFVPFFMILSMSSFVPTPVSRQMIASLMYGISMRLARKPGESADRDGTLPIRLQNSTAVSNVSGDVCSPLIISTPFCTGTGFIKCVLTTRDAAAVSVGSSGGVVAAAILVMEMEEVLVARMACGGAIRASWEKMSVFNEGISGTASMTKSAVERSSMLVVGERRERAESASDWDIRSLETSFDKSLSIALVSEGH